VKLSTVYKSQHLSNRSMFVYGRDDWQLSFRRLLFYFRFFWEYEVRRKVYSYEHFNKTLARNFERSLLRKTVRTFVWSLIKWPSVTQIIHGTPRKKHVWIDIHNVWTRHVRRQNLPQSSSPLLVSLHDPF